MSKYHLKELKIEVTYHCPLACVHCSSNAGAEVSLSMKPQECKAVLTDAIKLGVEKVAFSGGEPLEWDALVEMVQYATANHIDTTVYTSGNNKHGLTIFDNLRNAGLKRAVFSIYSSARDEHNRVTRIAESYDTTLAAVQRCASIGIIAEIHFVALRSNYQQLESVVKLAEKHGASRVSVLRLVPQGRAALIKNSDVLTKQQNIELKKIIQNLREKGHDIRTGSPFNVLWLNENPQCLAGQDRLIVAPDLSIYPCDAFKQIKATSITSGDTHSTLLGHSLDECWNSSAYLNAVRTAVKSLPAPPCASCTMYSHCKAGCLAQKFLQYGDLTKNPDPACLRVT